MAVNLILMGPPGVGKGTQAERFAREHGIPKVSTGDILREAVHAGTELGRIAKDTMDRGLLVSDDVMIGIMAERLDRPDAAAGFVLDGFPRTVAQAAALDRHMAGRDPLIVVNVVAPEEELVRRLRARRICRDCGMNAPGPDGGDRAACPRCGGPLVSRSDDDEDVVRERLAVHARDTQPLDEHYQSRPTFRSVDGNQPPDRVAEALREAVDSVLTSLGVGRRDRVVETKL